MHADPTRVYVVLIPGNQTSCSRCILVRKVKSIRVTQGHLPKRVNVLSLEDNCPRWPPLLSMTLVQNQKQCDLKEHTMVHGDEFG